MPGNKERIYRGEALRTIKLWIEQNIFHISPEQENNASIITRNRILSGIIVIVVTRRFRHSPLVAVQMNRQPLDRATHVRDTREELIDTEFQASLDTCQDGSNDDRSSAARFHKTLPHDDLGQVTNLKLCQQQTPPSVIPMTIV